MNEPLAQVISALQERAREIRSLEAEAQKALYERGDEASYRRKLAAKTDLLSQLPTALAPLLAELPEGERERIAERLDRFAASAGRARALESVFYMAALLYPADYREGEPNDLENWLKQLEDQK